MRESEVQPGYLSAAAHHDQDNSPTLSSFTKEGRISYTPLILVRYRDLKGSNKMADKLMSIPNNHTQNYSFRRLQ